MRQCLLHEFYVKKLTLAVSLGGRKTPDVYDDVYSRELWGEGIGTFGMPRLGFDICAK